MPEQAFLNVGGADDVRAKAEQLQRFGRRLMPIQVDFVSPEETLYSDVATQVVARTRGGGDIAFLTGHEPFIGSLLTCEVRVTEEGGDIRRFAVPGWVRLGDGHHVRDDDHGAVGRGRAGRGARAGRRRGRSDGGPGGPAGQRRGPLRRDDLKWAEVRLATLGDSAVTLTAEC